MKLSGAQFQQTILITLCVYLILSGLNNILETVTNPKLNTVGKLKAWTEHLFGVISGILLLMILLNNNNSLSTVKMGSIVLGILLGIHAVSMFMHNESSYKGQNLIVATFYIVMSLVFVGGPFFIEQSGGGYYPV